MRLCWPLSSVYSVMKTNRACLFLLLRRLNFSYCCCCCWTRIWAPSYRTRESKRVQCQRQENETLRAQCENLQREEFKGWVRSLLLSCSLYWNRQTQIRNGGITQDNNCQRFQLATFSHGSIPLRQVGHAVGGALQLSALLIHVGRAIERIKIFAILWKHPTSQSCPIILIVCSALANLRPELIKIYKNQKNAMDL